LDRGCYCTVAAWALETAGLPAQGAQNIVISCIGATWAFDNIAIFKQASKQAGKQASKQASKHAIKNLEMGANQMNRNSNKYPSVTLARSIRYLTNNDFWTGPPPANRRQVWRNQRMFGAFPNSRFRASVSHCTV
jgi:hypothetical protein